MDTPLLALTRRRAVATDGPAIESAAIENMRQLTQLRWIAVVGQVATILVVDFGLGVPLPLAPMLGVAGLLAVANLAAVALMAHHRATNIELLLALLIDVAALTAQLYLSGGSTNPFISLFLLQVVLGAILLKFWSAWVLVVVTSLCFGGLTMVSVPLTFPAGLMAESAELYTLGAWISFGLTATLLGLFITRITRNLHARDLYLADLRQHAAEEDGIVRMGLFASGAAHELGTPLASLSVILSDWRRMPAVARDPELAGEVEEMRAEVERCKAIVTDILHSAGAARVEAMEMTPAEAFLDEAVAAWRPTHPHATLDVNLALDGARVVAGPPLRQALWNLLDNAAEVSPHRVMLTAIRRADDVAIAVMDDGPGFTEARLAMIGRPLQSRKGAGHGLGLFLAANVARRLGGQLEAANREGGGAIVTLVLPLAPERPETR